ncbi:MAG: enoyl-CoA hydratase/isomerase family protein, partial [Actinomycetota bacterium]|nr:enoyl-CoA hydratase/isomerase family protein [Actinomycetota bacterium]
GHEAGPFRMWDLLGVKETVEQMDSLGIEVAPWVREMLEGGNESFYKKDGTSELQFSPVKGEYEPVREDPMQLSLDTLREEDKEISRNDSASILDLGDGVLCLEIHSRGNSIDTSVVEMGNEALRRLEEEDEWLGLVIGNEGRNFCVGANIGEMAEEAQNGDLDSIGEAVDALQGLLMGFRFASKPVVAAPHGQTLGGGAEICLHADRICAAGETYMGLVETGVGLIPAGGGVKELLRRLVSPAMHTRAPSLPYVQEAFEKIAMAKVSGSGLEAREMGFLKEEDRVVMNADHLINTAKREALELADGYTPPTRDDSIYAAGTITRGALEVGVIRPMVWGGYASEYDGVISSHLARVLTGGDLSMAQWVPEEHILKLEKEAFLELLKNEKTHERISAMLETGKPLRN